MSVKQLSPVMTMQLAITLGVVMYAVAMKGLSAMVHIVKTMMNARITRAVAMPTAPIPLVRSNAFVWKDGREQA